MHFLAPSTAVLGTCGWYACAGCSLCPAGTYGNAAVLASAACSGNCAAGQYSVAGSTGCTLCPTGQYVSSPASGSCVPCSAGVYGASTGLSSSLCSGFCPTGGPHSDGVITNVHLFGCHYQAFRVLVVVCPGQYSLGGATSCTLCPAGTYGANQGLALATCSGSCAAGSYSLAGATSEFCRRVVGGHCTSPVIVPSCLRL